MPVRGTALPVALELTDDDILFMVNSPSLGAETQRLQATLMREYALATLAASLVPVDTSPFTQNLGPSDSTVQAALETMDQFTVISPVESVNGLEGVVILTAADVGAVDTALLGVPSGAATLDSSGMLSLAQWPQFVSTVNGLTGEVYLTSASIAVNSEAFTQNLSEADTDLQTALETIDVLVLGGSGLPAFGTAGRVLRETGAAAQWVSDLELADGSYSAGTLPGGRITNAGQVYINRTYTQTADPADESLGSPIRIDWNPTLDYAGSGFTGPVAATGYWGPRGAINIEGFVTYNNSTSGFGLAPVPYINFLGIRNETGTALNLTPAWQYVAAAIHIADDAAVTMNQPDAADGPAAFYDSTFFGTKAAGEWDGNANDIVLYGFISNPFVTGDTHLAGRVGYHVKDVNSYPFGDMSTFVGAGIGETLVAGDGVVDRQVGFQVDRLTFATENVGIECNSRIEFWNDTATVTDSTSPFRMNGSYTLDFASATLNAAIEISPTVTFNQAANAFGAFGAFKFAPTIRNAAALTGSVFSANISFLGQTTWSVNTTNGAVAADTLSTFHGGPILSRSAGANTFTVTAQRDFVSAPTVNTGTRLTNRHGMYISEVVGSGTVGVNIGLIVESLSKGDITNIGIYNPNSSIMGGTIYGALIGAAHLTLGSTADPAATGDIRLANPTVELFVTNHTHTSGNLFALFADNTVTMNASGGGGGTGNGYRAVDLSQTVDYVQTGNGFGAGIAYSDRNTYKASTASLSLGILASFVANPTLNTTAAASVTVPFYSAFSSNPTTSQITSGDLTVTALTQFAALPVVVGANTTVTTRTAFGMTDAVNSGTFVNQYGLDIPVLSGASTLNVGIRNQSVSRLVGQVVVGADAAATNASVGLEVQSTTKALLASRMTTTQRDALTGLDGMVLYNTTTDRMNAYTNGAWSELIDDVTLDAEVKEVVDAADGSITWDIDTTTVEPVLHPAAREATKSTGFVGFDAGATVGSAGSSETTVLASATATKILANTAAVGDSWQFEAVGLYTNNSGANRTVRFRFKVGAVTLFDFTTGNLTTSALPRSWRLRGSLTALEANSTADVALEIDLDGTGAFTSVPDSVWRGVGAGLNNTGVDFTSDANVNLTVLHSSVAGTSPTITCYAFTFRKTPA